MKQILLVTVILTVTGTFGIAQTNVVQGTWQLVSYDHGQGLKNGEDDHHQELKMISSKHFVWVLYDGNKKKTLASGNGTYTLEGQSYVEHVDFIDVDPKLIGKDQSFTIKVEGDTLSQSGVLSDGTHIVETWKRVD